MANGIDEALITTMNELGWAMLSTNKKGAMEDFYKDILVSSFIGGFNIANAHYISASLKGNPDNIYKTTGIGFGVVLGIAISIGINSNKAGNEIKLGKSKVGKDYIYDFKYGLAKGYVKLLTKMVLSNILQRFMSPITKLVQKLLQPLLKLPKYADLFANINGSRGAGNGKAKEMFIRFILWLFIGAIGTLLAIRVLNAIKNKKDPKSAMEGKSIVSSGDISIGVLSSASPDISQAIKINKKLAHKPEFFATFNNKLKSSKLLEDIVKSATSSKSDMSERIKNEYKLLREEVKLITNGKLSISINNISNDQDIINTIRAIKSVIPAVKTTTDVAKYKFKNIIFVAYGASKLTTENIGIYNAAINPLNGDAYMLFYPTKNNSYMLSNDEIAAVMLHECGHFLTKQNSFAYINISLGLLTYPLNLLSQPITSVMVWGTFFHMCDVYGRYQEIQADKYATMLGYGNELASALAKLYQVNPEKISRLSNKDNSDVHSTLKLRYDTLKKYANEYKKR